MLRDTLATLLVMLSVLAAAPASAYDEPGSATTPGSRDFFDTVAEWLNDSGVPKKLGLVKFQFNEREKKFFSNPMNAQIVREGTKVAVDVARELCGEHLNDDESDAIRHYVLACYIGSRLGKYKALEFLSAHEEAGKVACTRDLAPAGAKCWNSGSRMDIHNNELGLLCGENVKTAFPNEFAYSPGSNARKRLVDLAKLNLDRGDMSVLKPSTTKCRRAALYPNNYEQRVPAIEADYRPFTGRVNGSTIPKSPGLFGIMH